MSLSPRQLTHAHSAYWGKRTMGLATLPRAKFELLMLNENAPANTTGESLRQKIFLVEQRRLQ